MRKLIAIAALSMSSVAGAQPSPDSPAANAGESDWLDLRAVTAEVLAVNPALKAARARWEAMKQRIPQARAWEDLQAGMDAENGGDNTEWMLMQAIPLSGKNRRAERISRAEAAAALAEVENLELVLASRARVASLKLANAHEQLAINRRNIDLLRQLVVTARARFESGKGMLADVLSLETELAKFQEMRFDIERELSEAQSELNLLLNRPAQSDLPKPPRLVFTATEFNLLDLQRLALGHRPELRAAAHRIDAADETIDLAKREWIPDPQIRTEVRHFIGGPASGMVEYDAGIFITVPWLNKGKYRAKIEEARLGAAGARHELEALQTETLRHVRDQLKKIETFHHHTTLFRNRILPLAQQTLSATRQDYEAGLAAITAVLLAARELQDIESTYWHHLAEHQMAVAELTPMLGGDPHLLARQTEAKGAKHE
jgi:outer membrane protein, heavy metal efflux system